MTNITTKDLMGLTPEELAEKQKAVLKQAIKDKLALLREHICNEKYDKALEMLSISPGGDDMGCDNRYLDCDDLLPGKFNDVGSVIDRLQELTRIIKKEGGE